MILVALSLCSLFELDMIASVIFTVCFTLCSDSAFIYLKLRYGSDEEEKRFILRRLTRAKRLLSAICRALTKNEVKAERKVKM